MTVSPRRFACILTFSLQVKHWFAAQGLSISDPELLWKILVSQQQIDGRCGVLIWSFNQWLLIVSSWYENPWEIKSLIMGNPKTKIIFQKLIISMATMSPQKHDKYRFWPPKNQVIYHHKTSENIGFWGPWYVTFMGPGPTLNLFNWGHLWRSGTRFRGTHTRNSTSTRRGHKWNHRGNTKE